jgi:hypothetical protein
MTPASPAHSVESISLVTGVCGHRREQALPINDRPVDLACSDELPWAVDRLYVEGQTAPGDAARRVAVISTLPPTGVARRCSIRAFFITGAILPVDGGFLAQ